MFPFEIKKSFFPDHFLRDVAYFIVNVRLHFQKKYPFFVNIVDLKKEVFIFENMSADFQKNGRCCRCQSIFQLPES